MVVTHSNSTQEKWQAENMYRFHKTKFSHNKGSIPITFHIWSVEHSSRVWSIFLLKWIFKILLNIYSSRWQIQDCICYRLGVFIWKVTPFGVKNGPPTYQRVMTKTFKKYLDRFMKIFMMILQCMVTWRIICRSSDYVFKSAKNMALI
jgi:hypothetical protein